MRITLNREFYIPSSDNPGFDEIRDPATDAVVYVYEIHRNGKTLYVAKAFSGKRAKPDFFYHYSTVEARNDKIKAHFAAAQQVKEFRAKRAAERKGPHSLKVGDILVCSWGYSMTLVDFYRVEATTPSGLTLIEIGSKGVPGKGDGYGQSGYVVADPDSLARDAKPFKVRCGPDNRPKISSHQWAHKWDGREYYFNTLD